MAGPIKYIYPSSVRRTPHSTYPVVSLLSFLHSLQSSPVEVLEAISPGIDLFDCSYTATATSGGYALSFPITAARMAPPNVAPEGAAGLPPHAASSDDTFKINLWSTSFR